MVLKSYIVKSPLRSFVVLNYLISWAFLYPCYQLILNAEDGTFPPLALIGLIGAYGPSIAAVIVERIVAGKRGVRALLKKVLIWNVHFGWYIFILALPLALHGFSVWSSSFFGFQLGQASVLAGVGSAIQYYVMALPFGPMGEELGWRGFMLPRLLQKYDLWKCSLMLGVTWTFWHIASFTFPGAAIPSVFSVSVWTISLYLLATCADTLLMAFVFLKTKGSVLIAILFHMALNASSNIIFLIFPEVENNVAQREIIYIIHIILTATLAVALLLNRRSLSTPRSISP